MSGTLDWVKCHKLISVLTACFLVLTGCIAGMMIHDSRSDTPIFIAWGGNGDPGDGNGGGFFKDQLVAGGWAAPEDVFQVTWNAAIQQGTIQQADAAMAAGEAAWNNLCTGSRPCINAGFSLGNSPALQLTDRLGISSSNTYLFGAPQPSTGIWHNQWVDNPWIEPAVRMFGQLAPDRFVPSGTQVFFDARDPYANSAPQCSQPWALTLDGHRVIGRGESQQRVWTGVDGAVMHESNYPGADVLPLSGNDPSPVWAGCYLNDWHSTPNSPGVGPEDSNRYGAPGVPTDAPGLPGGGEMPSVPTP